MVTERLMEIDFRPSKQNKKAPGIASRRFSLVNFW